MKKTARIVSMFLTKDPGHGRVRSRLLILPFTVLLLLSSQSFSFAASATWQLNPTTGDWNTAANWTPATVPNAQSDIATFAISSVTNISVSNLTRVDGIIFKAGASAYEITPTPLPHVGLDLVLYGAGIMNNSGVVQNFVNVSAPAGRISGILFLGNATAGDLTVFTNQGGTAAKPDGGVMAFIENSSAGSATFINGGSRSENALEGDILFLGAATAPNSTFINNGGPVSNTSGGTIVFGETATASHSTFTNNGGTAANARGGFLEFSNSASAGNITIINNGGSAPGARGGRLFINSATFPPAAPSPSSAMEDPMALSAAIFCFAVPEMPAPHG